MPLMEILFVATGFTGAMTLVWLVRAAWSIFGRPARVTVEFGPGLVQRVAHEIGFARHEVLVLSDSLPSPPISQALIGARERKAVIELILGAPADVGGGVQVLVVAPSGVNAVLVDGRTLLVGGGAFADDGLLLVIRDHPELIAAFREKILAVRGEARPARGEVPVFTLPPVATELAAADEGYSYDYKTVPVEDEESRDLTPPDRPADAVPAAVDLFARLRREVAAAREAEGQGSSTPSLPASSAS